MSASRRVAALTGLVLLLGSVVQVAGIATAAAPTPKVLVQNLSVAWAGASYNGGSSATAVIPGIGNVAVICKRDSTMVRLTATNRAYENQMWLAKYETKHGESVVAVKNVRVYKYATRGDTSGSGTAASAHEGLNQTSKIENTASGYLHGVISRRVARNADAATASTPPSTSFKLSWYWNGFRKAAKDSSCSIAATFRTNVTTSTSSAQQIVDASRSKVVKVGKKSKRIGRTASISTRASASLGLNWHGDADAANGSSRSAEIAGIGTVGLVCETGRDGEATLTLTPASEDSSAYVETIRGEGVIEDHVDVYSLDHDPETGSVGPIDLPSNGMMRIYFRVAGKTSALVVSSYRVNNNTKHPELNVCEIATAYWVD